MAETTISSESKRIAVVTGANKGIGFEISRQLATKGVGVVVTARDVKRGIEAVEKLRASGFPDIVFHLLDVNNPTTIASLADFLKNQFGKLDILVNNAAILGSTYLTDNIVLDPEHELGDVDNLTEQQVDKIVEDFLEDVKQDLIESKGWPVSSYIVLKAALNAYTRVLAKKYPKIATNAVSPGFTKTDINKNTGINTVEEAAEGPVKLALIADTGISGFYFEETE